MKNSKSGGRRAAFHRPAPEKLPDSPRDSLLDACLAAYIQAGSLDLSLDQLAAAVGTSKRMLIHYYGSRQSVEEQAILRLEETLRARFRADDFPRNTSLPEVMAALWHQTTRDDARNTLLLVMDVTRRAWSGSARARAFYLEQQRLWVDLLQHFSGDRALVEAALQLFQGCMLAYLITGNRSLGTRAMREFFADRRYRNKSSASKKQRTPKV